MFLGKKISSKTGRKIRLVIVATNKVTEVSQPKAKVPPKLLAQNIINPAVSTNEVYIILKPVCCTVFLTVVSTSKLDIGRICR